MNIDFRFDTEQLMSKLNDIVDEAKLKQALLRAGELVKGEAQAHCPVDTGALRNSIVVQADGGNSVTIGPTESYGIYVEFGTGAKGDPSVSHTTKGGWVYFDGESFHYTTGQAPQPFLVPALESQRGAVIQAICEIFN